jgi:hypothetical protein
MKKLICTLLFLYCFTAFSQNLKEYKASNDITYKIGDNIVMGKASGEDNNYVYMWITSVLDKGGKISERAYNGVPVTIKKIRKFKDRTEEKVLFLVGGGNITNYTLDIENAIDACEIKDCKERDKVIQEDANLKYDALKKLKELFDSGVLTKEEFEKEKEKILNKNE